MVRQVLENGVILPAEYSDDWYEDMTSNLTKLDDVIGSDSEKLNSNDVAFLRMSSAALTDGGTGNFSDLNSSNKLKTGDYVLDSGRKLYQIVSVDSTTERFTVGNSLFKVTAESDLAPVAESGDYDDLDNKPDLNPYDQHIANTEIHVTTADKNRWNNQTFVFRYSSTALVASSTNSNTLLDNTDNLKVGDKVIDSSGVLFSVTAIDTVNSTFTIGTALIDLALDANVMHLSGDETALGIKAFIGTRTEFKRSYGDGVILFGNGSFTKGSAPNSLVNICRKYYGDATSIGSALGYSSVSVDNNGNKTTYQFYCIDNTAGSTSRTTIQMNYDKSLSGTNAQYINFSGSLLPSTDNSYSLGNSTNKWSTINGLNPGSLSMPDLSNGVDISSYITHLDKVLNSYTPPANGYIHIRVRKTSLPIVSIRIQQNYGLMTSCETSDFSTWGTYLPVVAGNAVEIYISADSLGSAIFIPCQGNV